jgi:hypothetical protein
MQVMSDRLEHTVEAVTMLTDRLASVEANIAAAGKHAAGDHARYGHGHNASPSCRSAEATDRTRADQQGWQKDNFRLEADRIVQPLSSNRKSRLRILGRSKP